MDMLSHQRIKQAYADKDLPRLLQEIALVDDGEDIVLSDALTLLCGASLARDMQIRPAERLPLVRALLDRGVDISGPVGEDVLRSAAYAQDMDLLQLLVERGAPVRLSNPGKRDQLGVFTVAVMTGDMKMVLYLHSQGADLNEKDHAGNPLLAYAVANNALDVIQYLVACGADINARVADGRTLLMSEISEVSTDTVKLLLSLGLRIDRRDFQGRDLMHYIEQYSSEGACFAKHAVLAHRADCQARELSLQTQQVVPRKTPPRL